MNNRQELLQQPTEVRTILGNAEPHLLGAFLGSLTFAEFWLVWIHIEITFRFRFLLQQMASFLEDSPLLWVQFCPDT